MVELISSKKQYNPSFESPQYDLVSANNYSSGVEQLRKLGKEPFSFKENMIARLNNPQFYQSWLDSRAGIVTRPDSAKVNLILDCTEFKNISPFFNDVYIIVDHNLKGKIFYREDINLCNGFSKKEVLKNPFWLELVEGDVKLLGEYIDFTLRLYENEHNEESKEYPYGYLHAFNNIKSLMAINISYSCRKGDKLERLTLDSLLLNSEVHNSYLDGGSHFLYKK